MKKSDIMAPILSKWNKLYREIRVFVDVTYAEANTKEKERLKCQKEKALRKLGDWKRCMEKESPELFHHTLTVRLPYFRHWVKKYKTTTPGMLNYLQDVWDEYQALKREGGLDGITTLF